jgi:ABC-type glycerol-3-phosphate transport system substrate-binding protein
MLMTKKIFQLLIVFLIAFSTLFFSGCLKKRNLDSYELSLEVWGVFDDSDVFQEINRQFSKINPRVKNVKYKKISGDVIEYEKELTNAIANGNGPDIIFFGNTWLSEHQEKIIPLPYSQEYLTVFKENFVDVVEEDFVENNQIYSMPLYCDTLALFYNKDLFNQSGLTSPPKTWDELLDYVDYLTLTDSNGEIKQSAIALGRSKKPGGINRSSDILTLMMMQEGIEIYNEKQNMTVFGGDRKSIDVLDFYTQFALNGSRAYTWNSKMDYSIDSFKAGKTAMMINYSYWKNRLKEESPKLNFDTSEMPQHTLDDKINFSNYWGLAVVKNRTLQPTRTDGSINYTQENRIDEAWNYIKYVTTNWQKNNPNVKLDFDPTEKYLENTNKPSARRDLIEKQKNDPYLGNFAIQALTAKSWNQPKNLVVEEIIVEMIDEVVSGKKTSRDALRSAQTRINNLINK